MAIKYLNFRSTANQVINKCDIIGINDEMVKDIKQSVVELCVQMQIDIKDLTDRFY